MLCKGGAHTSAAPEPSAGRAFPQHSPREGSQVSRLCWPGRIERSHTYMGVGNTFILSYLSFRKVKPRVQGSTQFYTRGLKLCCECSFRGEQERTCVFEPNIGTMVWLHNIPPLRRKTHGVFTEEIQLVQYDSTTVNSKLTTMIRNNYSYKTYNHVVFAGFLPGFISVHGCFYFLTWDKILLFKWDTFILHNNGQWGTPLRTTG